MDVIPPAPDRADAGLKSLTKLMAVLECFSVVDRALTLAEIAARTGYPKSTVHRLVASLRGVGLLDQAGERDRYRLGLRLFALGNTVLANMALHREARPFVDGLARLSGLEVHLAVFDGHRAVVVARAEPLAEGRSAGRSFLESAPAHCTGVGKAILAYQPADVVARLVGAGLTRFTEATLTDGAALRADLAATAARGYAVDEGEHQPGLRCVAAPVRDGSGQVFAAISVSGAEWKLVAADVARMARLVTHSAAGIERALGVG